jgi:uncharacterized protein YdiU (UPF0061 family)
MYRYRKESTYSIEMELVPDLIETTAGIHSYKYENQPTVVQWNIRCYKLELEFLNYF